MYATLLYMCMHRWKASSLKLGSFPADIGKKPARGSRQRLHVTCSAKQDSAKRDLSKRDLAKRDSAKRDLAKQDSAKRDSAKRDLANRDGTHKTYLMTPILSDIQQIAKCTIW